MFARASAYNVLLVVKVFYVLYAIAMARTKNASSVRYLPIGDVLKRIKK